MGRQEELTRIVKLVDESRLVTLVGPGGAGKTRLATEAAATLVDQGGDGVWFVELAPITDPAEVAQAVLAAVVRRESLLIGDRRTPRPPREAEGQLLDVLGGRRTLLVIDNCEHLLDATAQLVDLLLAGCPQLAVLATSREPLGITGEALVVLAPLATPGRDGPTEEALASPAVRLFADRAADARPGFTVDDHTVADVVEIVRRLDGLPLAIELAAARLRTLPLAEVASRLSDRFRLLTGGSRTALPRHRTLRAVVEWSWDLLTPAERVLADRLAAFPSGANVESAIAVGAGEGVAAADVPDLLAALVDKSLLQLDERTPAGSRYRMLETIREFGTDRLAERGTLAEVRRAHVRYFVELAARTEPRLRGPEQLDALAELDTEHDNVVAALRYLCDVGDKPTAAQLALNLGWYWSMLSRHSEAATWFALVRDVPGTLDESTDLILQAMNTMNAMAGARFEPLVSDPRGDMVRLGRRLRSLDPAGRPVLAILAPLLLFFGNETDESADAMTDALASADPWTQAMLLGLRARLRENEGDVSGMLADADASYQQFRALGDRWGQASLLPMIAQRQVYDGQLDEALRTLVSARTLLVESVPLDLDDQLFIALQEADLHLRLGDAGAADRRLAEAGRLAESSGAVEIRAIVLAMAATVRYVRGDAESARQLLTDAERLLPAGAPHSFLLGHGITIVQASAAHLDLEGGDLDAARHRVRTALATGRETHDRPVMAIALVSAAACAQADGRPQDAVRLLGAAARLRGSDDPTNVQIARVAALARAALGDAAFGTAWRSGWALSEDEALAAAVVAVR